MTKTRILISFFLFLSTSGVLYAQQAVVISNYTTEDFANSRQHWSAVQDDYGKMIFGNSNAINLFDGSNWQYIHVPKGETVYSLDKSEKGVIYTGGEADIGFLYANELYEMQFSSLRNKMDAVYHNFLYVRQTHVIKDKVYFRSKEQLMMYDEEKDTVLVLPLELEFGNSFKIDDKIYVQLIGKGLYDATNLILKKIPDTELFADDTIFGLIPFNGDHLIYSRNKGLQLWNDGNFSAFGNDSENYLKVHKGYRMVQLQSGIIAIATLTGGIVFVKENGELLQVLDDNTGLNDNSVYGLYEDENNLLWAMLDDGISVIKMFSDYEVLNSSSGVDGIVRSVFNVNNHLYFSSNSGVFASKNEKPIRFHRIPQLPSQSYATIQLEHKIINATFNGLYEVIENKAVKLSNTIYEKLLPISDSEFLGWSNRQVFKLTTQNSNVIEVPVAHEIDKPKEWVLHDGNVYLVTVNSEVMSLSLTNLTVNALSLPQNKGTLFTIENFNDRLLVAGYDGIFVLNNSTNNFELFEDLSKFKQVTLLQGCKNDMWIRSSATLYKLTDSDGNLGFEHTKYNDIGENEGVYGINCINQTIWFGLEKRIISITDQYKNPTFDFSTNITRFSIGDDSLLYAGFTHFKDNLKLDFSRKKIRFNFASTNYYKPEFNQYQYKLQGFDLKWSEWTLENQKDFTNIPEGNYVFAVKSKNLLEDESDIAEFPFTILPPWYRTWWAYTLYLITFFGMIYGAFRIRLNQILKVQKVRNRIADDLHDDLSGTLIGISNFAKAISKNPNKDTQKRFIALIEKSADEAKEKISDIVWSINPAHDDWTTYLAKCRRYASDIFESNGIEYELNLDETYNADLEMEIRKNLWLIYKEIITNIIKHANATFVSIDVNFAGNTYKLEVRDNGKGFDLENLASFGNGLKTVHKRVETLKGEVELTSNLNIGTNWKIKIPV